GVHVSLVDGGSGGPDHERHRGGARVDDALGDVADVAGAPAPRGGLGRRAGGLDRGLLRSGERLTGSGARLDGLAQRRDGRVEGVDHGLVPHLRLPVLLHGGLPGGERLGELGEGGHGVLVGPFAGSRVGLLAGGLAVIGALTASALTASALTPGALTASALTAGALTAAGPGRLREVAEEHAEQRPAGAAHAQPPHVQRGEPAAVGGGLLGLEAGGDELHGGAHVGAEVAVAGAAVQVAQGVGGAEQGLVHAAHEAAAG